MTGSGSTLQSFYEAVAARDLASAGRYLADDLVFSGLFETYRGPSEYLTALSKLLQVTLRLDVGGPDVGETAKPQKGPMDRDSYLPSEGWKDRGALGRGRHDGASRTDWRAPATWMIPTRKRLLIGSPPIFCMTNRRGILRCQTFNIPFKSQQDQKSSIPWWQPQRDSVCGGPRTLWRGTEPSSWGFSTAVLSTACVYE